METNGANGGHQHKVFEKRPSPGTFPNRLDIELCICGVRRWVDQDGAPTTPWQFIRLGAKPGGNEGAGAALPAPPKSALDGLITCGSCGQPMVRDDTGEEQEAHYVCQPGPGNLWAQCQTPRLHARRTEALLAGTALRTVLTEGNISWLVTEANDPQRYDAPRASSVTRQDVKDLGENRNYLLHTPAAGRQPTRGHAPAGGRPAGGGTRLKGTVEQPQEARAACSPRRATSFPGDGTTIAISAF